MTNQALSRPPLLLFLGQSVRNFRTVGAVAPSGATLAAALTAPVAELGGRRARVLEVGAGTGVVTRALLPLLGPGSHLDVVELNPQFAPVLGAVLATASAGVTTALHVTRVEDLDLPTGLDVVVSGLPFANAHPDVVRRVVDSYLRALRPGGTLTYFSYLGTAAARAATAAPGEAARHRGVEDLLAGYRAAHGRDRQVVWRNVPPATVHRLQAPGAQA